jgi:hypothetical protein
MGWGGFLGRLFQGVDRLKVEAYRSVKTRNLDPDLKGEGTITGV